MARVVGFGGADRPDLPNKLGSIADADRISKGLLPKPKLTKKQQARKLKRFEKKNPERAKQLRGDSGFFGHLHGGQKGHVVSNDPMRGI